MVQSEIRDDSLWDLCNRSGCVGDVLVMATKFSDIYVRHHASLFWSLDFIRYNAIRSRVSWEKDRRESYCGIIHEDVMTRKRLRISRRNGPDSDMWRWCFLQETISFRYRHKISTIDSNMTYTSWQQSRITIYFAVWCGSACGCDFSYTAGKIVILQKIFSCLIILGIKQTTMNYTNQRG